ncbi:hypothetical protein TYRP_010211 [Tyrophagus putrescentiae]|nr:hypothetical protein TYRP_010211 [Tyrophagus putrescentiae]
MLFALQLQLADVPKIAGAYFAFYRLNGCFMTIFGLVAYHKYTVLVELTNILRISVAADNCDGVSAKIQFQVINLASTSRQVNRIFSFPLLSIIFAQVYNAVILLARILISNHFHFGNLLYIVFFLFWLLLLAVLQHLIDRRLEDIEGALFTWNLLLMTLFYSTFLRQMFSHENVNVSRGQLTHNYLFINSQIRSLSTRSDQFSRLMSFPLLLAVFNHIFSFILNLSAFIYGIHLNSWTNLTACSIDFLSLTVLDQIIGDLLLKLECRLKSHRQVRACSSDLIKCAQLQSIYQSYFTTQLFSICTIDNAFWLTTVVFVVGQIVLNPFSQYHRLHFLTPPVMRSIIFLMVEICLPVLL